MVPSFTMHVKFPLYYLLDLANPHDYSPLSSVSTSTRPSNNHFSILMAHVGLQNMLKDSMKRTCYHSTARCARNLGNWYGHLQGSSPSFPGVSVASCLHPLTQPAVRRLFPDANFLRWKRLATPPFPFKDRSQRMQDHQQFRHGVVSLNNFLWQQWLEYKWSLTLQSDFLW